MASLWIGSDLGWPERDFGVVGELSHVGAHFKVFDALIFMLIKSFDLRFFYVSLDCPLEQCAAQRP